MTFPINKMIDDMRKVPKADLAKTDAQAVAKYYGLDVETVEHWVKIFLELNWETKK